MIVVTCKLCRAWYNMDMEYHLDDEHFDFRTGESCSPTDQDWYIIDVPYRDLWRFAQ